MSSGAVSGWEQPALVSLKGALHTPFRVHLGDDRSAELTLVEVEVFDRRPGWERFSLVFDGPAPPAFWHGTYTVEHPELGSFPLFLVAVRTDGDGQQYEAIFNRPAT